MRAHDNVPLAWIGDKRTPRLAGAKVLKIQQSEVPMFVLGADCRPSLPFWIHHHIKKISHDVHMVVVRATYLFDFVTLLYTH